MLGVFEIHPKSSSLLHKQRLQTAIDGRSGLADDVNINLPFPSRYFFKNCLVLVRNVFRPFYWMSGVNAEILYLGWLFSMSQRLCETANRRISDRLLSFQSSSPLSAVFGSVRLPDSWRNSSYQRQTLRLPFSYTTSLSGPNSRSHYSSSPFLATTRVRI